jgi:hypothetical protein
MSEKGIVFHELIRECNPSRGMTKLAIRLKLDLVKELIPCGIEGE